LSLDVDLVFYDTTSVYFETEEEDKKLGKRDYSKNGRSDAPQMIVGMAVTRDGFSVKSWVFPGNTTDVTTIERVKEDLKGWRLTPGWFPKRTWPSCVEEEAATLWPCPGAGGRTRPRPFPIPAGFRRSAKTSKSRKSGWEAVVMSFASTRKRRNGNGFTAGRSSRN
jgi:hypothetical protein